jgi:hypothetical protein
MIALFRIAKRDQSHLGDDVIAGVLLTISVAAMLAPGGLYLFSAPWNSLYVAGQVIVWMTLLGFLLHQARREKEARIAE